MTSRWLLRLRLGFRWLCMAMPLMAGLLSLAGCGDPGTGPAEVKWDRVTCDRCRMVLSARHYAAQIRTFTTEGKSSLHYFDDIGCALIWLDQQPWRDDPRTQIWVNDWRSGLWIDARTAHFLPVKETPMQYGLGAQPEPAPGAMDFGAAKRHIYAVEEGLNAPILNPGAPGTPPAAPSAARAFVSGSTGAKTGGGAVADARVGAANPTSPPPPGTSAAIQVPGPANPDQDHPQPHPRISP